MPSRTRGQRLRKLGANDFDNLIINTSLAGSLAFAAGFRVYSASEMRCKLGLKEFASEVQAGVYGCKETGKRKASRGSNNNNEHWRKNGK